MRPAKQHLFVPDRLEGGWHEKRGPCWFRPASGPPVFFSALANLLVVFRSGQAEIKKGKI
jgi:hypothetical protein